MKLCFGRQFLAGPACVGLRLNVADIDRSSGRQRNLAMKATIEPSLAPLDPVVWCGRTGMHELQVLSVCDFVLADLECGNLGYLLLEFVVPAKCLTSLEAETRGARRNPDRYGYRRFGLRIDWAWSCEAPAVIQIVEKIGNRLGVHEPMLQR